MMSKSKCSYADKYNAIRIPKCGCDTCADKWNEKQRDAAAKMISDRMEKMLKEQFDLVWSGDK